MDIYKNIPEELKKLKQWCCWQAVTTPEGRVVKKPINPITGYGAQNTNPATWTDYETAVQASRRYNGIGFMFANGYFGVDIDGVKKDIGRFREGKTDNIVYEFIHTLESYAEYSQSGNGIHVICKGGLPEGRKRRDNVEMYHRARYFIMTGNIILPEYTQIVDCTEKIKPLYNKYISGNSAKSKGTTNTNLSISEIIEKAKGSRQGTLFSDLKSGNWEGKYKSQSEADIAFCNMLAFWTGRDYSMMDEIFRSSGLMRPKWDELRGSETYGTITINEAISKCENVYSPTDGFCHFSHYCQAGSNVKNNEPNSQVGKMIFEVFDIFEMPDTNKLSVFPVDLLPTVIRDMSKDTAEALQVSNDMAAVAVLAAISLSVQGKFCVNPLPGWLESLNLYTTIIAEPSERKSSVYREITKPIFQYEAEENERRLPEVEEYRTRKDILTRQIESMKRNLSSGKKKDTLDTEYGINDINTKKEELHNLKEVAPLRLAADDITPEKLAVLLKENNEVMGILSAEGGIFDIMAGRYSNDKSNIEIVLKGYSGDTVYVDRIGRESLCLKHPLLTFLLFVQPVVIQEIMDNREFKGRGLLARFLYSIPSSTVGNRKYRVEDAPAWSKDEYSNLIYKLQGIPYNAPVGIIKFSKEADELAEQFFYEIEKELNGEHEEIKEWAGKFHGQTMRIAGVLHCVKHIERSAETLLEGETMESAIGIGHYFLEHAKVAFAIMGLSDSPEVRDAKYILKRIESSNMHLKNIKNLNNISKRDLFQLCKGHFKNVDEMDEGLKVLIERGYICMEKVMTGEKGRPSEMVYLNPEYVEYRKAKE